MHHRRRHPVLISNRLPKCPTGIRGLDEITDGGLPRGRPTLVCGGAGCGKTLLASEFLVRGATQFNEPGVFVSFEETGAELTATGAWCSTRSRRCSPACPTRPSCARSCGGCSAG
jgi:KaiC/GvpD/RAD55 family RecA-like ATPase